MKFRFHRGRLEESLETTVEVNSLAELTKIVEDKYRSDGFSFKKLKCEHYGFDKRINWDSWIISQINFGVIGFSNGELK